MNTVTDRMIPGCVRDYLREFNRMERKDRQAYLTQLCRTYGETIIHNEIDKQRGVA